ncbi:MAG: hypothetical protein JXQ96_08500 [Cyclobacteriaceae bacterium]
MKKKPNISKSDKKAPFEVPENYFDKLSAKIEARIEAEESKSLVFDSLEIKKSTPFQVPEGYFDKLSVSIQEKVELEQADDFGLEFINLPKQHPFQIPNRYFEELPSIIQDRVIETKKDSIFSWVFGTSQAKWALVPAMMALFILGYSLFFQGKNGTLNTEDIIAEVSTQDLVAYLEQSDLSSDDIIETVNFDDMELELDIENTDLIDELNFSDGEIDDILLEFEIETGV